MKIINPSWSTQKTENITTNNVTHFSFIPNQQGGVCIRCIGDDEKETWVYAAPQKPGKVLVVDPLGKGDRYGRYYEHALNNNYYPYTYWDKHLLGVPDNATSDEYPVAIFFTANACGYAVYPEERDWIKRYLDRGGKLLISGQDIAWDANAYVYLGWFNTYLHATYDYDWESNSENVVGVSGDAIGNGLSFTITNDLYPLLPDEVGAISPATPILNYTSNHGGSASIYTAGVKYAGSNKTVYLAFSFETISSESTRNELLERSLRWLVLPDFTLSSADISFEPEEPVENTTVKINITIHNSAAGNLSVPVQLWEGEPSIGKKMGEASASLLPWNSTNISFDWKATPKGLHDIYVTIDYDNVVKEGNETNNNASKTLNVLAGELFTHNFSVGWNLVCIPVTNNYRNAKALIENITWCEAVSKWNLSAQKFEVYKLGSENNFELEAAGGYFVYVTQNSTLNASGTQINITPSLVSKWQCFGVTNNSYPDAEALAQNITGCKAVAYWDNALGRFVVHIKGIGISNFSVKRGVAYLIWRD
ncbi:MAG: CARDB domain-containing protein [Candidatus Thermoplasmatota archaeon]|nr:CARDB domain-containing protein [Candidatus Thermoplasmatota archaeon]